MNEIRLNMPFDKKELKKLNAGDNVLLSGTMFVFRDAGHKRLFASIETGKPDIDFAGETVYFMGPCPAQNGQIMGSCGPTTSCRMDKYTPYMFDHGLCAQVGKGKRSADCVEAFKRNGGVYFAAIGGAGALYGNAIKKSECIAFDDLLSEAVYRLEVEDFPAVVAMDCHGGNIYR